MKDLTLYAPTALSLPTWVEAQDVPLTVEGRVPGQPFQFLQNQIDQLKQQVGALQATGANRIVFSGTIDLNSAGDLVRTDDDIPNNRRRVRHFKVFAIPGLTTQDLPSVSLYQRRRTDLAPFSTSGFFLAGLANSFSNIATDITNLVFEEGQILLQFRVEVFNLTTGALLGTFYGLDGPGGTGDFRLVLIK